MSSEIRGTRDADEDGFHEIQLSGKQLVFLCMATTLVSIVIFLCGVLVGRGVKPGEPTAEAAVASAAESTVTEPVADPPAETPQTSAPAAQDVAPTPVADAPPADVERKPATPPPAPFVQQTPVQQKPAVQEKPAPPPSSTPTLADAPNARQTPPPATPPPAPAAAASGSPSAGVIAVQVTALRNKGDADALARRLSGKGYAAYVVPPDAGAANPVYKVRVGNYTSPDEAARVRDRLRREEKFDPWIIR